MDWIPFASVAVAAVMAIIALGNRDRALQRQISDGRKENAEAIVEAKSDMAGQIKREAEQLHNRVGRVQENYVRRDDFESHLRRFEKSMDDLKGDFRAAIMRLEEKQDGQHSEIKQMINSTLARIGADRH